MHPHPPTKTYWVLGLLNRDPVKITKTHLAKHLCKPVPEGTGESVEMCVPLQNSCGEERRGQPRGCCGDREGGWLTGCRDKGVAASLANSTVSFPPKA